MIKKTQDILFKTIEGAMEHGANREYGEFDFSELYDLVDGLYKRGWDDRHTCADLEKIGNYELNNIVFGVQIQVNKIRTKEIDDKKISDCMIELESIGLFMDELRLLMQKNKK